jgi:hypothetical protein
MHTHTEKEREGCRGFYISPSAFRKAFLCKEAVEQIHAPILPNSYLYTPPLLLLTVQGEPTCFGFHFLPYEQTNGKGETVIIDKT